MTVYYLVIAILADVYIRPNKSRTFLARGPQRDWLVHERLLYAVGLFLELSEVLAILSALTCRGIYEQFKTRSFSQRNCPIKRHSLRVQKDTILRFRLFLALTKFVASPIASLLAAGYIFSNPFEPGTLVLAALAIAAINFIWIALSLGNRSIEVNPHGSRRQSDRHALEIYALV